jgi:hypothetical protein
VRSRRGDGRARVLVATLAVGLLGTTPLVAMAATADPSARGGLQVIPVSTQHWQGANDVLLEVLDGEGRSLAAVGTALRLTLAPPDGATPLEAVPVVARTTSYGRALYRARVPFHLSGRWGVGATATDGSGRSGTAQLQVSDDMGTPPLGSRVPGGATPTLRDAGSLLRAISSDPEPLGAFYVSSLDEALANGQPLAFVVDSYAYRPNAACGGALGILHEIFIEFPALTVVHAEPWRMRFSEGQLTLDPPGGPAVLADWSRAWGIIEPPWVFVVDADGRLHAKFTGVLGTDELRTALSAVTRPQKPPA